MRRHPRVKSWRRRVPPSSNYRARSSRCGDAQSTRARARLAVWVVPSGVTATSVASPAAVLPHPWACKCQWPTRRLVHASRDLHALMHMDMHMDVDADMHMDMHMHMHAHKNL